MIWYPLGLLKSKMTSVKGIVAPFRVLSQKMREDRSKCQSAEVKKCSDHPQNRILVPFRGFF